MFNLILYALITLAVFDLIVGVSNDAVNFLNSAIGSKSIPIKKILIIASLGIFVGAVFSSGMMEVARKGIFNPGEFYFDEIMFIFLAVMIGDILLLDFFNTLGLPTSTTVSIVFNLLGAAVMMSLIKIGMDDSQSFADLVNYINTEKGSTNYLRDIAVSSNCLYGWYNYTMGVKNYFYFSIRKENKKLWFFICVFMFDRYRIFHLF